MIKEASIFLSILFTTTLVLAAGDFDTSNEIYSPNTTDLDIKLGVYKSFESGLNTQSALTNPEKKVSNNKKYFAFYSDAAIYAYICNKINDIEYGGKIILVPTSKRKSATIFNGSYIFIKSDDYGTIEAGSPVPAGPSMMIGDGSIPTRYLKITPSFLRQNTKLGPSFLTSHGYFIGNDLATSLESIPYSNEPPRTINYYSPKFDFLDNKSRIQIGISYTPDTSNTGTSKKPSERSDSVKKKPIGITDIDRFEIDKSIKNAFTIGFSIEQKLPQGINLKIALTSEYGTSMGNIKTFATKVDKYPIKDDLANLKSYNIGTELKIHDFTYGMSYGSFGKSLTTSELHRTSRKSRYYSFNTIYRHELTTTKISYFNSNQYGNMLHSIKLNVSYLFHTGLRPYAEISSYRLKGKPEFYNNLVNKKTKGLVGVVGLKLAL